jgi:hypothetical protein
VPPHSARSRHTIYILTVTRVGAFGRGSGRRWRSRRHRLKQTREKKKAREKPSHDFLRGLSDHTGGGSRREGPDLEVGECVFVFVQHSRAS